MLSASLSRRGFETKNCGRGRHGRKQAMPLRGPLPRNSALEQREAALAEREAAMARASAAAEYARSEAEALWRNHKASPLTFL